MHRHTGVDRVAIVDFDVHHGEGWNWEKRRRKPAAVCLLPLHCCPCLGRAVICWVDRLCCCLSGLQLSFIVMRGTWNLCKCVDPSVLSDARVSTHVQHFSRGFREGRKIDAARPRTYQVSFVLNSCITCWGKQKPITGRPLNYNPSCLFRHQGMVPKTSSRRSYPRWKRRR